jgi:glyoxylase-like metal-dependent hydrolase (beta-lactamase superfamily II)
MKNNIQQHKPIAITKKFYRLGTQSYPVYLSLGKEAMIIEGGISGIADLILKQLKELEIEPGKIRYIALTHTHSDHIGAVPYLKKLYPDIKIIASSLAAELLKSEDVVKDHVVMEEERTKILIAKGEITWPVSKVDNPVFNVDIFIKEGDAIDLGSGVKWKVYETTGHSPCHLSYYEESEQILALGDATGFYVPEKDLFWPNYFNSLEEYCNSIKKLYALSARLGVLSHNYIIRDNVGQYLKKAMQATKAYHKEMLARLEAGEDPEDIAMEKARWVNTLTDEHPFEIMYILSKVLIKKSQAAAGNGNLFIMN